MNNAKKLSPVDRVKRWWRDHNWIFVFLLIMLFTIAFVVGSLWMENYIKALAFRAVFGDL